jgi:putative ABC transport system ATP-binding protein
MSLISIQNLLFRYPGEGGFRLSVPGIEVEEGESLALFGPSGCGKSTLLNLIAGELRPSGGSLHVCGKELSRLGEDGRRAHRIRNIGFVFQDFPLVGYLDALENVLLPYRVNPALVLDVSARERARQLLEGFGIGGKLRSLPSQLSQGECQRVAIARALVNRPMLLLADEPTAGLDPERSQLVMQSLEEIASSRKLTMLVVTHDPAVRARFSRSLDMGGMGEGS